MPTLLTSFEFPGGVQIRHKHALGRPHIRHVPPEDVTPGATDAADLSRSLSGARARRSPSERHRWQGLPATAAVTPIRGETRQPWCLPDGRRRQDLHIRRQER